MPSQLAQPDGEVVVTVRADNNAREASFAQLLVGVDTTRPNCSVVSVNGRVLLEGEVHYTNAEGRLTAEWSCLDAQPWQVESVLTCEWAVGRSPGSAGSMGWRAASRAGLHEWDALAEGTPLENGAVYFVTVRCNDWVDLATTVFSGGLMADLVGPRVSVPTTVLQHTTGLPTSFTYRTDRLSTAFSFVDLESGVARIRADVTATQMQPTFSTLRYVLPTEDVSLHDIDLEGKVYLEHGSRYYLHVCAQDLLHNTACSSSAGFLVDLTPPNCTRVEGLVARALALPYFTGGVTVNVGARWECSDPESGIAQCAALNRTLLLRTLRAAEHPSEHDLDL